MAMAFGSRIKVIVPHSGTNTVLSPSHWLSRPCRSAFRRRSCRSAPDPCRAAPFWPFGPWPSSDDAPGGWVRGWCYSSVRSLYCGDRILTPSSRSGSAPKANHGGLKLCPTDNGTKSPFCPAHEWAPLFTKGQRSSFSFQWEILQIFRHEL